MKPSRLCIYIPSYGDGGVERMLVNLSRGLIERGALVDFLVSKGEGPYLEALPDQARLIALKEEQSTKLIPLLARYLRTETPDAILSAKLKDDQEAFYARKLADVKTRLAVRVGTTVSKRKKRLNFVSVWKNCRLMRTLYPLTDTIVAVSKGVAKDVARITGITEDSINVISNPVITPELRELSQEPVDHPWFSRPDAPIILGAGGLRRQKDFSTLIRAFYLLRKRRKAKLVILGQGRQKSRLERLAVKLGIEGDVSFPGFADNPYAFMSKSHLFVLSSLWEGSPNVLTEALAVGTPVISTDCESGPKEILQEGLYGPLVPVGDIQTLYEAMLCTLDNPLPSDQLRSAVRSYTVEASAAAYSKTLRLETPHPDHALST